MNLFLAPNYRDKRKILHLLISRQRLRALGSQKCDLVKPTRSTVFLLLVSPKELAQNASHRSLTASGRSAEGEREKGIVTPMTSTQTRKTNRTYKRVPPTWSIKGTHVPSAEHLSLGEIEFIKPCSLSPRNFRNQNYSQNGPCLMPRALSSSVNLTSF